MPRTILLLLFGDLGDTILTVPAVRALRQRYPDARLVLLGKPVAAEYLTALGLVDEIVLADKHLFDRPAALLRPRALLHLVGLFRRLRRLRADRAIVFHHLVTRWGALKFAGLLLASGANERLGLDNGRGWFLTSAVPDRGFGAVHEAEYWLEVARLAGAEGTLQLEAPIGARDRETAEHLLAPLGRGSLLAVHAGTGPYGPGRRWFPRRFAQTIEAVRAARNAQVILVGTSADAEATRQVEAELRAPALNLIGRTSVGELAAVLARCDAVLANDGGVAHLAAAAGTPVVTVFGPSNERAWRPLGGTVVAADLPCRPCFYRDFETGLPAGCATRECLRLVTPAEVSRAVLQTLDARVSAG